MRLAQGEAAGRGALAALPRFLLPLNAAAAASLAEAGEQLITLHQLNVPATLHVSLLSANAIENVMRHYCAQTAKGSRWRLETNQVSRWTATALRQVERGFHRIKGHSDLPQLLTAPSFIALVPSSDP